jgi:hypothetical protein
MLRAMHASIEFGILRRGGVAATHELLLDGHTSHGLTAAVRSGRVIRIRQGHYCLPSLPTDEVEAFRVGGRLGGMSGARRHGIWTPDDDGFHVVVPDNAARLRVRADAGLRRSEHRDRAGTRVAWRAGGPVGTRTVLAPLECVLEIARTWDARTTFVCAESALHQGMFSQAGFRRRVASLPAQHRGRLLDAGRLSGSGGESFFRWELDRMGIAYEQQVEFLGVGRVDFVVDGRHVVEVDGAEFHTSREAFEEDRRRDAALAALGRRVLRFSYTQVVRRWDEVERALLAALDS